MQIVTQSEKKTIVQHASKKVECAVAFVVMNQAWNYSDDY